ncbi:MAG: Clp protease ClpS [Blastopirellula sp.]|nr:MAG: Clp protease ClpS [Blastopirellula sp.]
MSNYEFAEDEPGLQTIVKTKTKPKKEVKRKRQPRYHVLLWNDEDHTYEYVILMLRAVFGHTVEKGFQIAESVDNAGRAVCLTTTREHAELKRDQIHAYGKDDLIAHCQGSMSSTIEPDE